MLAAGSLKERTIRRTEDRGLGAEIGVVQMDVRAFVDNHQGRCHRDIDVLTGTRRRAPVQRRQYREVISRSAPPNPVGRPKSRTFRRNASSCAEKLIFMTVSSTMLPHSARTIWVSNSYLQSSGDRIGALLIELFELDKYKNHT